MVREADRLGLVVVSGEGEMKPNYPSLEALEEATAPLEHIGNGVIAFDGYFDDAESELYHGRKWDGRRVFTPVRVVMDWPVCVPVVTLAVRN